MPAPILMHRDEVIPLKRAMKHSGKSEPTIRRWCRAYGIARQASRNAPLEISILALEMVLHADFEALEVLRAGDRASPLVRRYVEHLGLPG